MTPIAITMLVISLVTIWGGLALSLVHLSRHPEVEDQLPEDIAPEL